MKWDQPRFTKLRSPDREDALRPIDILTLQVKRFAQSQTVTASNPNKQSRSKAASHELISEFWRICTGLLGRSSLTTIRNGDGPAVRPRRTGRTERPSASASSKLDKIPLITNFISNCAKAMPMQRRTPPPNGKYSKGE